MSLTASQSNERRRPGKIKLALSALTTLAAISLSIAGAGAPAASAQAPPPAQPRPPQLAFGLTTGNALVRFDTANPGMILGRASVRGLQAGESLVGIDFRPANNALYGVGSTGRLYTVDPASGVAQQVGPGPLPGPVQGTAFGVDVNPVPDRLRVVSTQGQNLRINMDTLETLTDGGLAYAAGDRNAGQRPTVVGAAYTNNMAGATTTMLYVVDAGRDVLALQNPPNDGVLNTVGALGVDASEMVGFDVAPGTGAAFAALSAPGAGVSTLYSVDLASGAARRVGLIGGGQTLRGMALVLDGTATFSAGGPLMLPRTGLGAATGGLLAGAVSLLLGGIAMRGRRTPSGSSR
ncbi:MAG TPA: DUF4394 domain-containing protein [Chloroflexota bacterium]|nr:DUF4394 domain-containing protein [Chloroflexota bacterium]